MALTLIKEDGTGKVDANSYAAAADGDAYHDGHLYASAWTAVAADRKAAALVMATRLIDSQHQFNGFKAYECQALQWPRMSCPDPDVNVVEVIPLLWRPDNCVESNVVPKAVADAGRGDTANIERTKSGASCRTNGNGTLPATKFVTKEFNIVSELLAEGWAGAIAAGKKQKQLPVRFDGLTNPSSETPPGETPGCCLKPFDSRATKSSSS